MHCARYPYRFGYAHDTPRSLPYYPMVINQDMYILILERKSERELKVWVQETVAPEIYEIAYALEDRIDIWFSNLKKQIGITDRNAKITIRNRYLEIV